MASPNLRTNIASGDTGEIADTNTVHSIVNAFDTGLKTATAGQHLAWNGAVYAPVVDNSIAIIKYNGSTLPLRSTVTTDLTKTVFWASPLSYPPPSGGGYAIDGVDFWLVIP
jgi:hypothetical protein